MSLAQYVRNQRLVVQGPNTSAYEAVRALEDNHIGAIIVQERGQVVGIVTDRDLAQRVIGLELDARRTPLKDVMTPGPVTLDVDDSEEQAAKLMRARHVRRIPIVSHGHPVGIVTFDDLLTAGRVDVELLEEIVEAQLAEPAKNKPAGAIGPTLVDSHSSPDRRTARAEARARRTFDDFKARLTEALGLADTGRAYAAFQVVAQGLFRRMTKEEAADFAAQLPSRVKQELLALEPGPDPEVTLESMDAEMAARLGVDRDSARVLVRLVGAALADFVSEGELDDIVGQLPAPMKGLLVRSPGIDGV